MNDWTEHHVGTGKLVLHCGAHTTSREELAALPVPEPMGPHHKPIAHLTFLDLLTEEMDKHDLAVVDEAFGVTAEGNRFFGLLALNHQSADYQTLLGLRGSHDQSMSRIIGLGSHCFACDNLAFSMSHELRTKQTTNIMRRLPGLIHEAVGHLPEEIERQDRLMAAIKAREITEDETNGVLIEAVRQNVLPPSRLGKVIHLWDRERGRVEGEEPIYGANPTAWTTFNVLTETMRPADRHGNVPTNMDKTHALTRLIEQELELAA